LIIVWSIEEGKTRVLTMCGYVFVEETSMKKIIAALILVGALFGALRIYGFYIRETRIANERRQFALNQVEEVKQKITDHDRQDKCIKTWFLWRADQMVVEVVELKEGKSAAAKERARFSGDKPTCDETDSITKGEAIAREKYRQDLLIEKYKWEYLAKEQDAYAKDRKAQTKELFRVITGS
jgi:hypothetical protein